MHPSFFDSEDIRSMPDEYVFDEMLLSLKEFDIHKYEKTFDGSVSFGYYKGSLSKLKKEIEKVDPQWTRFFDEGDRIYCGYIDGKTASFCIIGDMGTYDIGGGKIKVGGPGCVGTLPEYRDRGIGLTMVKNATDILKKEGYDYSYIHYTYLAPWYEKLGYKTLIKWNRDGIINTY